jgi:hypothetical protein
MAKATTARGSTSKAGTPKKAPAKKVAAKNAAVKKAAPAARRAVPKESPLKGMPVEQWIQEKASGWQLAVIQRLVGILREAAPDMTATIKWGQPVFESNGPIAYLRPAKAHVTFGFWRGGEIADPKKLLEGAGDRMQHMKIAGPDQLDAAAIKAMVQEAVRLNREKGSPTMRRGA